MDQIKLSVLSALSHSWYRHSESLLLIRAIKCLVNGIKALFGRYSVSVFDGNTQQLMKEHPNARFTQILHKPLSAYNISIPSACKRPTGYVSNKTDKLHDEGRRLQVKLAFKQDGSVVPIPMYNSDNTCSPICLNGKAHRSDTDTKAPGAKIVCRHFAWAYATKVFGRGKDTFKKINTPEKIQTTFANTYANPSMVAHLHPEGLEDGATTVRSYYADGYYFREGKFSEALTRLVEKYWNMACGDEKNFLIDSRGDELESHHMALRLKKQDGCMKVIFYDPNATLMHKTILLSEPGLAAHITGEDLGASYLFDGALVNIDDRKKSADRCDIQFFGGSPTLLLAAPGHLDHPLFGA
ncbi:ShET2/EspL2 family type III secretion system effector toxin [Endozoicomonas acroporae]|uniref:ShET2/EspL2 family type III secretion system effector toxin n=1 Tax=Endozoicomonas acroporae TaxID=1701104 RepID=UPI003D792A32